MKKLALFGLALTACLPLASGRPAAAATTQETVVAQASGETQPFALAWSDDTQGNTKIDQQASQKIASAFAGAQYLITDGGHLLIAQGSGNNLNPILPPILAVDASNNQGLYFVVHVRSSGTFVDGVVIRNQQDPTQGLASLDLVLINQQGASESVHVDQLLTWAASQTGGGNGGNGGGNGGGTGGGIGGGTSNPFGF